MRRNQKTPILFGSFPSFATFRSTIRFTNRWLSCLILFAAFWLWLMPSSAFAEEDEVYILIHKQTNRLSVMLNNTPVYTFPVATGRGDLTPIGEFRIVTKVYKPYYLPKQIAGGHPSNPLGTRWLGLNIDGGYKYGIHGTNRPGSIGHSVSSGCIRMRNKDVEYLYRHIPLKTRVVITDD